MSRLRLANGGAARPGTLKRPEASGRSTLWIPTVASSLRFVAGAVRRPLSASPRVEKFSPSGGMSGILCGLMETIKTIMTRRSIRAFKDTPVMDAQIKILLEAAMNAPSAGDGRPWHFVVVKDRAKLNALADAVDEGKPMFKQAQAAILICLDESLEKFKGFGPQDCSCAAQNLQLAAHDMGLGAVWIAVIGVPPRVAGCRKVLGVPETIVPFALFPVGWPGENLPAEYRYDESRIHKERW